MFDFLIGSGGIQEVRDNCPINELEKALPLGGRQCTLPIGRWQAKDCLWLWLWLDEEFSLA